MLVPLGRLYEFIDSAQPGIDASLDNLRKVVQESLSSFPEDSDDKRAIEWNKTVRSN